MLYKIDLSRAFRHVKLNPADYDLLGLRHVNWYVNIYLPFGYRNGSVIFQRLSDTVRHIMRRHNFDIINYIDEVIGIDVPSRIDASFDALYTLLHHLGFEVSQKKLVHPSTVINCLGILVDTKTFTLAIPNKKLQEILQLCQSWHQRRNCTKRQLQSLGSLLYVSKCVRTSRFYLNRLLEFLHSMEDRGSISLTVEAKRDINWFLKFLPTFNGTTFFDHRPITVAMELDASLQGLGARWGDQVYTLTIPLGHNNLNICHLEMLNILLALRIWKDQWANSRISVACDNQAVVQVLNSGKTRDLTLAAIARNIQFQAATRDIDLRVTHIPGKSNIITDFSDFSDVPANMALLAHKALQTTHLAFRPATQKMYNSMFRLFLAYIHESPHFSYHLSRSHQLYAIFGCQLYLTISNGQPYLSHKGQNGPLWSSPCNV